MVVFNISIWTGLVGEGVGMVTKWQHGKVYFWRKEKIVSLKLFQYLHLLILSVRNLKRKKDINPVLS